MYQWWEDPIYDRTQQDIDYQTKKGYLNAVDVSRIEGNLGTLARDFQIPMDTKKWEIGGFLRANAITRIISNTTAIKTQLKLFTTPFSTLLRWEDLNTIEYLLFQARQRYLLFIDWDCWECLFDTWDDFERIVTSWDEYETVGLCQNNKNWVWFEELFSTWDVFEEKVIMWDDLECKGEI